MIPAVAQRSMAERGGAKVTEVPGSHAIYVSHPEVVARSSRKPPPPSDVTGSGQRAIRSLPTLEIPYLRHLT